MATGPRPRSPIAAGSGLATLARAGTILRSSARVFTGQGSRLRDSDAWSSKGVLVTEVEVPGSSGNLEIVSTHLIAGGDLANTPRHRRATEEVRFGQVADVLAAVEAAHRSGNATLIVGDFNVPAGGPSGERLAAMMGAAGYRDLWLDHGVGPGWTCDALAVGAPITAPDADDERFCADPAGPHDAAERLDYAFAGTEQPGLPLTVRSMRRRVFPRSPDRPEHDAMPLLSDHVALHLDVEVGT